MNLVQFADDTSVFCTGNSKTDLRSSMLENVHKYLNEKSLRLISSI